MTSAQAVLADAFGYLLLSILPALGGDQGSPHWGCSSSLLHQGQTGENSKRNRVFLENPDLSQGRSSRHGSGRAALALAGSPNTEITGQKAFPH